MDHSLIDQATPERPKEMAEAPSGRDKDQRQGRQGTTQAPAVRPLVEPLGRVLACAGVP